MAPPDSPTTGSSDQPDATQAREEFLRYLRHELRTPVNHIIGYSEMLQEEAEDLGRGSFVADLQKVHEAGRTLLNVIGDNLTSAQLESGKLDPMAVTQALRLPIDAIVEYTGLLLEEAEAADWPEAIPDLGRIQGAGRRLGEMVDMVLDLSRMQQAPAAPDQAALAEAHTPARPAHRAEPRQPVIPSSLLVVDDNDLNRDMLSRRLQRLGHHVTEAEDGGKALNAVRAQPFDLVLLDIMMPGIDGYQVLQAMKADERLREIPVIMLSAYDDMATVVRGIELGAEDYLGKPFDPVLLRARLGACLEKKRLRDKEVEYLRQVARVTAAAAAVEDKTFDSESLVEVSAREDELGQLARVFQRMAREVYAREQRLQQQVQQLKIEIDEVKKAREVSAITKTEYFQDLQQRARSLRSRNRGAANPPADGLA